jgi:hypothetical protein
MPGGGGGGWEGTENTVPFKLSSYLKGAALQAAEPKELAGRMDLERGNLRRPQKPELVGPQGWNPRAQRTCPSMWSSSLSGN